MKKPNRPLYDYMKDYFYGKDGGAYYERIKKILYPVNLFNRVTYTYGEAVTYHYNAAEQVESLNTRIIE